MKKFLFFFAALLFAGSMMADPYTLKFNGTGGTGDSGTALGTDVAAVFTEASQAYVASVDVAEKVYPGRIIKEDPSSLKFGTSSAKGKLEFTLKEPVEVDSIIVNATQYGNDMAEVTVNGTKVNLINGNKEPQDCKATPSGIVSKITIAQTGDQRIYVRSVTVFPKAIVPVVTKDLKLVPGVWKDADAALYAWAWQEGVEGKWAVFNGEGDTLVAKIQENATHVKFVRFAAGTTAPSWEATIWNQTENQEINECGLFIVKNWDEYVWCGEEPTPPTPGAKFYITGDGEIFGNWNPAAIPVEEDSYTFKNLAIGNYKMKVTLDGTWEGGVKGYDDLTVKAEGLSKDNDGNICFTLAEIGDVTVTYTAEVFKVEGNFYVPEPPTPGETKDLKIVAGAWADKQLAVWAWQGSGEGAWYVVEASGEDLVAKIPAAADHVIVASFEKGVEIKWDNKIAQTADLEVNECLLLYINDGNPSWCSAPEPPTPGAKFFITGDAALVGTELAWHPDAIKVEAEDYTFKQLAKGTYKLKVTVDGTWETAKGFDNLTEVAGGLSADGDNNICFTLEEAGDVKVTYTSEIFKLEGNFYIEPLPPIVVKDLKLVPGVWKNDGAALYVWAWQDGVEGKWAVFNGEGDTLVAKIQENATKAIFVRFEAGITDPVWDDTKIWNKTDDQEIAECGIFFVNDWDNYSWCSAPEPPQPGEFVDIILVPGVWKEADAKFAAVTFTYMPEHMGPEALKDAVISDWFVANEGGGSFTGRIPKDAKVIGFGRFNPAVEKLTIETVFAEGVMWNHSDIMYIDESMLFTITGWEEGRDYCPGYWGEAPQPGEPVWFLVGDMTEWQKNPISFAAGDIKVNLTDEGRDYGFKILRIIGEKDETWYGNNGTMTREYNQDWIFDAGEQSNCKLTVDVAGEYVFSLVIDGNDTPHVSVTYPNKQGLDDVNSENVVVKTIRNGQVLIIRGEHIYTTVGQMVK